MAQERIPFDIKYRPEIEAGKYLVVTKDGREVRISQWDWLDEDYPIIAFIKGVAGCLTYTDKGEYVKGAHTEDINLFLVAMPDYKEPAAKSSVDLEKTEKLDTTMLTYAADVFSGKILPEDISYSYRLVLVEYFNGLVKTAKEDTK